MRVPDLVLRASFRTSDPSEVAGVDSLFRYDYMGSAEYEFGALPTSLRRIVAEVDTYVFHRMDGKASDGRRLMLFARSTDLLEAAGYVDAIASGVLRTRDGAHMAEVLSGKDPDFYRAEVWWDLYNDWIAFLGEKRCPLVERAIRRVAEKWAARDRQRGGGQGLT